MRNILKYIQWGLIVIALVPLLTLIVTADHLTRILSAISIGAGVFYKVIDFIKKDE